MIGLVLTAGGARGAYQAGIIKRVSEIPGLQGKPNPFAIIAGASAGAINGAAVACAGAEFTEAASKMAELWSGLRVQDVFRTDFFSLSGGGLKWLRDLSFGPLFGNAGAQSLLDFTPLKGLLTSHLPLNNLPDLIARRQLYALAITATSYFSGKSYTFIQGQNGHPLWKKSRRESLSVPLSIDHIWASCAIPVVFQPVKLDLPASSSDDVGPQYFGDGGLRLVNPLSPAIRLGASKLFAIGIRCQKSAEKRSRQHLLHAADSTMNQPPLAQIFGIALNSIFLDHLDTDVDHLIRMNELIESNLIKEGSGSGMAEPMKIVRPLVINPSVDLAEIAEAHSSKMPKLVRHFMDGLGNSRAQSADLMSYLLFDSAFTKALIDTGYQDASRQADEIEEFLLGQ